MYNVYIDELDSTIMLEHNNQVAPMTLTEAFPDNKEELKKVLEDVFKRCCNDYHYIPKERVIDFDESYTLFFSFEV